MNVDPNAALLVQVVGALNASLAVSRQEAKAARKETKSLLKLMQKQEDKRSKDHEDEKHEQKQERDIADFAKFCEEKDISAYLISDDGHFEGPCS